MIEIIETMKEPRDMNDKHNSKPIHIRMVTLSFSIVKAELSFIYFLVNKKIDTIVISAKIIASKIMVIVFFIKIIKCMRIFIIYTI